MLSGFHSMTRIINRLNHKLKIDIMHRTPFLTGSRITCIFELALLLLFAGAIVSALWQWRVTNESIPRSNQVFLFSSFDDVGHQEGLVMRRAR